MRPSEYRAHLRAALSECRRTRGDSQEHLRACFEEVMLEPAADHSWWLSYFQSEAKRFDVAKRGESHANS